MNKLNLAVKLSLVMGLGAVSSFGWAGCSTTQLAQQTWNIPAGTAISVNRNTATGAISSLFSVPDSANGSFICWGGTSFAMLRLAPLMEESSIPGVYKTNIEGIGVKVSATWSRANTFVLSNDVQRWYTYGSGGPWSGPGFLTGIKVQFYITGPVSTGAVTLPKPTVELWANDALTTTDGANYVTLSIGGSITVKARACETPNITVDLDKHDSSEFSGIYSKSTPKAFNFEIKNCDPGMNSVNYTFAPATGVTLEESGTANQYLTLDSSSTASGVGIQVLYDNGDIVPFNKKIKYTGYKTSVSDSYVIPMKARYIQTDTIIHGGKANSALEFTMSYE